MSAVKFESRSGAGTPRAIALPSTKSADNALWPFPHYASTGAWGA